MISAIPAYFRNADDRILSLVILLVMFAIFWISPVKQVTDSAYSMLLTQSLIEHGTFSLDQYPIPRLEPTPRGYYVQDGTIYQLELIDDHIYYYLPPGTSVLSLPYVAIAKVCGLTVTNSDGTYNQIKEIQIEAGLAALLMAIFTVALFRIARLFLPTSWSLIVSLGGALGTQVWSTASRAMWSDTWRILLLSVALYLLSAHELGKRKINSIVLATLMAWLYFVRPTNSVHIAAITIYLFLFHRELIVRYLLTGAVWLGLFVAYSWHYYHQPLPSYYKASRLYFGSFWTALSGQLISPARGLIVYVPVIIFVAYVVIRYWRNVKHRRLVWLSLTVIAAHMFVISSFPHWWGGSSYGSRLSTGLVPWFALCAILGIQAMRAAYQDKTISWRGWRSAEVATGLILLVASVAINGRGAVSRATWIWNTVPRPVDQEPQRLWDWRQPQFLAGLVHPLLPANIPVLQTGRIEFAKVDTQRFLWYGWSISETEFRWTDGKAATVIFTLDRIRDFELTMKLRGFVSDNHPRQRVEVRINDQPLRSFEITKDESREYGVHLSQNMLKEKNVLTFVLPDAIAPSELRNDLDVRELGIAMYWMDFEESINK